jgi:hypothetical protein
MFGQGILFFILLSRVWCDQINRIIEKDVIPQANLFGEVEKIKEVLSAYTFAETITWLNSSYFVDGSWSRLQVQQIVKSNVGDEIQMVSL